MTSMTIGQRANTRTIVHCVLCAWVGAASASWSAVALAQAQSPACARASLMHSTHNKDAAKWDRICAAEHNAATHGQPPNNQGAANQAAQRQAALEKRRQEILAQQRQPQPQPQERSSPASRQGSPNTDAFSVLRQLRAEQQRRLALMRERQRQNQGYGYPVPVSAPAPAATGYPVAAPAAPPSPSNLGPVAPSADPSAGDPPATADVLTPGVKDASLVNDQTAAKRAKADLSVFGVSLGDPVTRPRCAQLPVRGSDSCVAEGGFSALVASMFQGRVAKLSGFSNVAVQLPDSQCPDWLKAGSCTVVLAMKNGYPYAAFMVAGGEDLQANIETLLNQKYSKSADKSQLSQCQKGSGTGKQSPLRVWAMHGVRAEYDPVGARCTYGGWTRGSGQIIVETNTFRQLTNDAEQAQSQNQAKM